MKRLTFAFGKRKLLDLRDPGVAVVILPGCWELQEGGMQPEESRGIWGTLTWSIG